MEKKELDWANIGFSYRQTDKRFVANYKNGAWDEGTLTDDPNIVMSECACVLQYAQTYCVLSPGYECETYGGYGETPRNASVSRGKICTGSH